MWSIKTGDLLKEIPLIWSYEIFYDNTSKRWLLNTGDCLIDVTAWAGLTVQTMQYSKVFWLFLMIIIICIYYL